MFRAYNSSLLQPVHLLSGLSCVVLRFIPNTFRETAVYIEARKSIGTTILKDRCLTKSEKTKYSPSHSRYYFLGSTFMTKPGPEIFCVSVLNAGGATEDVSGLVTCDMQRYVMVCFVCFLPCVAWMN